MIGRHVYTYLGPGTVVGEEGGNSGNWKVELDRPCKNIKYVYLPKSRYGFSFSAFKGELLNSEGRIAIICPNQRLLYWAKRMVGEILGKPQKVQGDLCFYDNREIHFIVGDLSDEGKLWGLDAKFLYCGEVVIDDYLGVMRP